MVYTFAEPHTLEAMAADIEALRAEVDVLDGSAAQGLGPYSCDRRHV